MSSLHVTPEENKALPKSSKLRSGSRKKLKKKLDISTKMCILSFNMTVQPREATQMNNFEAINFIKSKAEEMVAHLKATGVIRRAPLFKLNVRPNSRDGWSGGIQRNGTPIVNYSLGDRYTNMEAAIKKFKDNPHVNYKEQVWKKAQRMAVEHGKYWFVEYSNIANKPEIGGYVAKDNQHILLGVVAHEVAHAVQHWNWRNGVQHKPGYHGKPHGLYWQEIYAQLRRKFVNNYMVEETAEPMLLAANKKTAKPMRLTTAFKQAKFTPSKVKWDKELKANKICAMFDGKKSMVALQFQGEGDYKVYDVTMPDFLDGQPLVEVGSKEGQKLLDYLTATK